MSIQDDIKLLRKYNAWRRGDEIEQPLPVLIGHAIDNVVQAAARYEALRVLNVSQFSVLYCNNILHGKNFDAMVDELISPTREN